MRTARQHPLLRVKEIESRQLIRQEVYQILKLEGPLNLRQIIRRSGQKESTIRRTLRRMEALKEINKKVKGCTPYYSIKYSPSK